MYLILNENNKPVIDINQMNAKLSIFHDGELVGHIICSGLNLITIQCYDFETMLSLDDTKSKTYLDFMYKDTTNATFNDYIYNKILTIIISIRELKKYEKDLSPIHWTIKNNANIMFYCYSVAVNGWSLEQNHSIFDHSNNKDFLLLSKDDLELHIVEYIRCLVKTVLDDKSQQYIVRDYDSNTNLYYQKYYSLTSFCQDIGLHHTNPISKNTTLSFFNKHNDAFVKRISSDEIIEIIKDYKINDRIELNFDITTYTLIKHNVYDPSYLLIYYFIDNVNPDNDVMTNFLKENACPIIPLKNSPELFDTIGVYSGEMNNLSTMLQLIGAKYASIVPVKIIMDLYETMKHSPYISSIKVNSR